MLLFNNNEKHTNDSMNSALMLVHLVIAASTCGSFYLECHWWLHCFGRCCHFLSWQDKMYQETKHHIYTTHSCSQLLHTWCHLQRVQLSHLLYVLFYQATPSLTETEHTAVTISMRMHAHTHSLFLVLLLKNASILQNYTHRNANTTKYSSKLDTQPGQRWTSGRARRGEVKRPTS